MFRTVSVDPDTGIIKYPVTTIENFEKILKDGDMADVDKQIDEFQMENELAG